MRTQLLATARSASKGVLVGGLAAVSFGVTGVALAAAGNPMAPTPAVSHSPATGKPATPAKPKTTAPKTEKDDGAPKADRSCPWPTPAHPSTAGHDNGLHCGWYKPGHRDGKHPGKGHGGVDNSAPHAHATGKPADDDAHETD
jgi:hypothetical protein